MDWRPIVKAFTGLAGPGGICLLYLEADGRRFRQLRLASAIQSIRTAWAT